MNTEGTADKKRPMRIAVSCPGPKETLRWVDLLRTKMQAMGLSGELVALLSENDSAPDADYAIGWKPHPGFFEKHRQLKYFFNAGAGLDHFFNNPAMAGKLPEGMRIIRLEDAGMGQQMADFCRHQVFDWMYGFARYRDQQVRQEWRGWRERYALERPNMPVGVLGLGVLGTAVARSFAADGFKVYGHARTPRQVEGVEFEADLPRFLEKTRVLIVLAPSTAETRHIIRAETIAMLPKGAYLINIARGALVNEPDLIAALDSGHLEGAGLDVFEQEPLPAGHPLWTHPKVVVTPHASAPTLVHPALDQILAKIARLEAGLSITGLADGSNS